MKKGPTVETTGYGTTGYGTTIADGFFSYRQASNDSERQLSPDEIVRAAVNVTRGEAEVAQRNIPRTKRRRSSRQK